MSPIFIAILFFILMPMSEEYIILNADEDQLTQEEKLEFLQEIYQDSIESEEGNTELNCLDTQNE